MRVKDKIGDSEALLITDKGKHRKFDLFIEMINKLVNGETTRKKIFFIEYLQHKLQNMLHSLHQD